MAINKKSAPVWTKVVIIVVAITFIASVALVGFAGFSNKGGSNPGTAGSAGSGFAAQYQPQVDAAIAASKSDPTNSTLIANIGHAYYEWAVAEYEAGALDVSRPYWLSAVAYYDQALAINPDDNVAKGNKAFALTYAGSPDAQSALEAFIATQDPQLSAQIASATELLAQVKAANPESTESSATTGTP